MASVVPARLRGFSFGGFTPELEEQLIGLNTRVGTDNRLFAPDRVRTTLEEALGDPTFGQQFGSNIRGGIDPGPIQFGLPDIQALSGAGGSFGQGLFAAGGDNRGIIDFILRELGGGGGVGTGGVGTGGGAGTGTGVGETGTTVDPSPFPVNTTEQQDPTGTFQVPDQDPNFPNTGPTGIPGPATETLNTLFPLQDPAAGGPTFEGFKGEGEDELSRLINERLGSIVSGEGLPSTAASGLNEVGTTGLNVLGNLAEGTRRGGLPEALAALQSLGTERTLAGDLDRRGTEQLLGIGTDPQAFDTGEIGAAGEAGLRDLISSGGFNPDLLFQVRQSLREQMEGELAAGRESLVEEFAARRLTGGGGELSARFDLRKRLTDELNRNLRDFSTSQLLAAEDRRLAASQGAGELGTAQRGQDVTRDIAGEQARLEAGRALSGEALTVRDQDLQASLTSRQQRIDANQAAAGLGLEARSQDLRAAEAAAGTGVALRAQDIAAVQADLNAQLSAIDSATGRALGVGDLALRGMVAEQDFIQFLMDDQFRKAEFMEAAARAREGDERELLKIYLQYLGQLQQGQVK